MGIGVHSSHMTDEEYWHMVTKMSLEKIPIDILITIFSDEEITEEQEQRMLPLIREEMK